ncbi:MAG: RNA polymerase sigma factor RpoD/SigA [Bacteroidetes bacterium]|nr:RNA polymerase sigma factor RpoD/SigA [Bacteroidota bacterium]MBP7478239.1 RNA polymerase sigma factor RpoD/SigA [Chitinophagales bacterium]
MRQLKLSYNYTFRDSISFEKYIKDINRAPLLNPEEERELAKKIQAGDEAALEKMVKCNLRFVVSVAKQYQNQGILLSDLINEGNIGLLKAARRFDESKGFKFISYAVWWIRQSIQNCIYEYSRTIRLPVNRISLYQKISKFVLQYEQENNVIPSEDIICKALDISEEDFEEYSISNSNVLSLDIPLYDDSNKTVSTSIKDSNIAELDASMIQEQEKLGMMQLVNKLSEREALILKMHYGLEDQTPMSLEDIGDSIDLTRERVRQIKEEALKKLRQLVTKKN